MLVVDETTAQLALLGKVGLALSGGGLPAALFHVGVLARLAELNILRTVDVLSCVSGGSIVGAQYYLELRHLLMTTVDGDLQDDILDIVSRIESRLLAAVQTNLRMRVAAHIPTNAKMMVNRNYSRTNRVGELLERGPQNIGPNPEQPLPGEAWPQGS